VSKIREKFNEVKPTKKQAKFIVYSVLVIVALILLFAVLDKVFAGSFSTGTASESVLVSANARLTGLCLYGDGTNSSSVYMMDDTDDDQSGDNIISDTLYLAAGDRGPVCISYAGHGGINVRGLVSVMGGTGGRYGVTYDRH
jgi:hypothetical protein